MRWASALALICFLGTTNGAPITFNTALPVATGQFIARGQLFTIRADARAPRRDLEVDGWLSVLGYGINENLAVFAALPYLDKSLEVTAEDGRLHREASGFGDLTAFARQTLMQRNAKGRTTRIAAFAGLTAPSGDDDDRDALGRVPAPLQPGDGSWDYFAGVIATHQTLAWQLDAQLGYRVNGEANDFEAGDAISLDGSLQYRLWPREVAGTPAFLYGVLELKGTHSERNRVGGQADLRSGGTEWFLSPGIQYITRRWIGEAAVQLPIIQNLPSESLETDAIVRVGFRVNF